MPTSLQPGERRALLVLSALLFIGGSFLLSIVGGLKLVGGVLAVIWGDQISQRIFR